MKCWSCFASWVVLSAVLAAGVAHAAKEVPLIDPVNPAQGWRFNNGPEFPGAKGGITLDDGVDPQRRPALRLDGDFTGGGGYVDVGRNVPNVEVDTLTYWIKVPQGASQMTVRLIDGTGQCHQLNLKVADHGNWQQVILPVTKYFDMRASGTPLELVVKYENWGGTKDGKWHQPMKGLHFLASPKFFGEAKKGEVWFSGMKLLVVPSKPYKESFDARAALPQGWTVRGPKGAAAVVAETAFDGANALHIQRDEKQLNDAVEVTGALFAAAPGAWNLGGALRSALHSPDNSFNVMTGVETLDANDKVIERKALIEQAGTANWKPFSRMIEFPKGTEKARFVFIVNKTHGTFDADALTAAPFESKAAEKIVERVVITGSTSGHLFMPDAPVEFEVDVQTSKALPADARQAVVTIVDYWGAEVLDPITLKLAENGKEKERLRHVEKFTLPVERLEVGKYFEVHVNVAVPRYADAFEFSGFARLPKAESHNHPARDIPFSIRNWDSTIASYYPLADRIGIRLIGTWGDANWEKIRDLGDLWYGGPRGPDTPGAVERNGWKNTTEEKVRQCAIDFMTKHKDEPSLGVVMLGNEPNERPELVAEKVRAYQIAYEALKSVKPDIFIVTTSVPALETFFEAGYYKYTDAYDYHTYGGPEGVRNGIRKYRELAKKYNAEKPIWCTELGLNSQGQTRQAVAETVVKNFTAFFAEGGANVSWFTIMYPDTDGKLRGGGGEAHNTFDAQYNRYNPKLDAIMNYVMINNITVKKCIDEVQHSDGVQDFLFRDPSGNGDTFQVLWMERPLATRGVKVSAAGPVRVTRVDGSMVDLTPDNGVLTLGLSTEPVLLRYTATPSARTAAQPLARDFAPAAFNLDPAQNFSILKGQSRSVKLTGANLKAADFVAEYPPRWNATFAQSGADVICTVTSPAETEARTGRVMIRQLTSGKPSGELILTMPIMSPITAETALAGRNADGQPGIRVIMTNNGLEPKTVNWTIELLNAWPLAGGVFKFNEPGNLAAYLKGETEGRATLDADATHTLDIHVADFAPQTLYRVRTTVTDDAGRRTVTERFAGGFAVAKRVNQPVAIDGSVEPFWNNCPPETINTVAAALRFGGDKTRPWQGPEDLSATWRAAWDDTYLYLLIDVTDDVFSAPHVDGAIWNQDGLQFLFDPTRTQTEKAGKYDYSVGLGKGKDPQAWCNLTAHPSVPEGNASSAFKVSITNWPEGGKGGKHYKLAIPWTHLAPFKPLSGANLGMGLIINEDDGDRRVGYSSWFSGPHTKNLDDVGDLILE